MRSCIVSRRMPQARGSSVGVSRILGLEDVRSMHVIAMGCSASVAFLWGAVLVSSTVVACGVHKVVTLMMFHRLTPVSLVVVLRSNVVILLATMPTGACPISCLGIPCPVASGTVMSERFSSLVGTTVTSANDEFDVLLLRGGCQRRGDVAKPKACHTCVVDGNHPIACAPTMQVMGYVKRDLIH